MRCCQTKQYAVVFENCSLIGDFEDAQWHELIHKYVLPPSKYLQNTPYSLSFGVGCDGSGVQMHVHGPVWAEGCVLMRIAVQLTELSFKQNALVLFGLKRWILFPPEQKPEFNPDFSAMQWVINTLPTYNSTAIQCVLAPGELLWIPNDWWHLTLNIGETGRSVLFFSIPHVNNYHIVFMSTFV